MLDLSKRILSPRGKVLAEDPTLQPFDFYSVPHRLRDRSHTIVRVWFHFRPCPIIIKKKIESIIAVNPFNITSQGLSGIDRQRQA